MIQKLYTSKYLEAIVSFIVLLPVTISFILNPLTNDARIYQALAKITDYFGAFPQNIDLTYEVKPIGNRFMNYFLYKATSFFTTFQSLEYETLFKIFAAVIVLLICYYFSRKVDKKYIFLITAMAFLTPLNFVTLQPDWWASLFAFLALSLFLTEKQSNHYLAGAIITVIFLFKGATIFLVIPIACALYFFKKDYFKRLLLGGAGSVVSLLAILFCGYFPNIIPDMLLSPRIARVGLLDIPTMILAFTYNMVNLWFYIPVMVSGFVCAYWVYNRYMKNKEGMNAVMFILMWIGAAMGAFIQSEFFIYMYVALILPAIITIILYGEHDIIKYAIAVTFIFFIICSSYWGVGMRVERDFYGNQWEKANIVKEQIPDLIHQDTILYIDSGVAPYYFPSNSSCRYVQPMPFQRNNLKWNLTDAYQYQEEYVCIMNYTGKYIIEDNGPWFKEDTPDMKVVRNKLNTEYDLISTDSWSIYRRII